MNPKERPVLKVSYFSDAKGRNEFVRLILEISQIPYQDDTFPYSVYTSMCIENVLPYGQLPVLHVDGKIYGQSCAIARYCAKTAGMYPTNLQEAMFTDGIVDSWRDMLDRFYFTVFHYDIVGGNLVMVAHAKSLRFNRLKQFLEFELKPMLDRYESFLLPSGQVLESLYPCWADIAIFDLVKAMERSLTAKMFNNLLDGREKLLLALNRINNMEQVKAYYLKNPNKNVSILWAKVSYSEWVFEFFETMHVISLITNLTKYVKTLFEEGQTLIFTSLGIPNPKHMTSIATENEEPTSPQ